MGKEHDADKQPLSLEQAQRTLDGRSGRDFWRSLGELAETESFTEMLHREFPKLASEWDESFDRRKFVSLMGASLALGGLTACTQQPIEKIVAPPDWSQ